MIDDGDLMHLRACSLQQPYASLVGFGEKRVETRSRDLGARPGEVLAIHASIANFPDAPTFAWETLDSAADLAAEFPEDGAPELVFSPPKGAIVALARVSAVARTLPGTVDRPLVSKLRGGDEVWLEATMTALVKEARLGDWSPGRVLVFFSEIERLVVPVPARGALGLWAVPLPVSAKVWAGARVKVFAA
jgi:hypothetical protein